MSRGFYRFCDFSSTHHVLAELVFQIILSFYTDLVLFLCVLHAVVDLRVWSWLGLWSTGPTVGLVLVCDQLWWSRRAVWRGQVGWSRDMGLWFYWWIVLAVANGWLWIGLLVSWHGPVVLLVDCFGCGEWVALNWFDRTRGTLWFIIGNRFLFSQILILKK